jgi:hypothetical protein
LEYQVGYGVSDYLSFGIAGSFLSKSYENSYGPGSSRNGTSETVKSSGWKEPEIGLIWRASGDSDSSSKVHLFGGVRPKLQKAKSATSSSDGNVGIGGTIFDVSVALFKEVRSTEFSFTVKRTFNTVMTFEDASDSSRENQSDEHQETTISLGVQGQISGGVFIGGDLQFNDEEKYTTDSFANDRKVGTIDYGSRSAMALDVFSKFKIDERSLLVLTLSNLLNYSQPLTSNSTKYDSKFDSGNGVGISWMQEF